MKASTPQEMALFQKFEAWSQDVQSTPKEYALALCICNNGEDESELFLPEFALLVLNEHIKNKLPWSILVWRAWFIWWTRAEQLKNWAAEQQPNAEHSVRTLVACANANAWYKAWNWAMEERPENAGLYANQARTRFAEALVQIKNENTPLRSILKVAFQEEPWYENAKFAEQQNLSI